MKKLLFLLGFLLPLWMNAQQIDSFSVAGRTFRFEIPKDWVLEVNSDSLKPINDYNIGLRYPISTKKINSKIFLAFCDSSITSNNTITKKTSKLKVAVGKTEEQLGIFYYTENVSKNASRTFNYQLGKTMFLTITIIYTAKPALQDSFLKVFKTFSSDFMRLNRISINNIYNNSFINAPTVQSDSFFYFNKYYSFYYPTNWICNKEKPTPFLKNLNLNTHLTIMHPNNGAANSTCLSFQISNVDNLFNQQTDTIGGNIINYITFNNRIDRVGEVSPNFNNKSIPLTLEYYIKLNSPGFWDRILIFRLDVFDDNVNTQIFYHEAFRKYIADFLNNNSLETTKHL